MRRSPLTVFLPPSRVAIGSKCGPSLLLVAAFCLAPAIARGQATVTEGQAVASALDEALPPAPRLTSDSSHPATENSVVDDPYFVFVAEESAHLRCGPAGEYYRTDPLRHGQELEVYVETGDDWLGVRPTGDSFCWVPAGATRLLPAEDTARGEKTDALLAEITEDKTVAWIGTNLGRARRYRWQVQLGEGETVTVLGRSERDGPDGPQTWYRIVPPSGEFRWIHRDQVVTTAEELLVAMKTTSGEGSIDFLPAGPSHVTAKTDQRKSKLRRVSDDQPYREDLPAESAQSRQESIAEIRRLDEIERNIEARARSRLERTGRQADDEVASDDPQPSHGDMSQSTGGAGAASQQSGAHRPVRSFSKRVADGLSALVGGPKEEVAQGQPSTASSRRLPELVPIGSGLAASTPSQTPTPPVPNDPAAQAAPQESLAPEQLSNTPKATAPPTEAPSAKLVAATEHPELRSGQSQVAILSTPRLVTRSAGDSVSLKSMTGSPPALAPPAKTRTITPAQLEEVGRSVAGANRQSLPLIMSSLMARGASAPEIRLVADAAQAFSMHQLAQRAREYEALARRRDGDTVVAGGTYATPTPSPVGNSMPSPVARSMPSPARLSPPPSFAGADSQGENAPVGTSPTQPVAPVTYLQEGSDDAEQPPAGAPSGVLVEVYSADPDRPPYAITDRGGKTLAYVTPAPGLELRKHLGSEVQVHGERGFLQGLDTPHILATQAQRAVR